MSWNYVQCIIKSLSILLLPTFDTKQSHWFTYKMNALVVANTKMSEVRSRCHSNPIFHGIALSGKGRTKKVIIEEMNDRIRNQWSKYSMRAQSNSVNPNPVNNSPISLRVVVMPLLIVIVMSSLCAIAWNELHTPSMLTNQSLPVDTSALKQQIMDQHQIIHWLDAQLKNNQTKWTNEIGKCEQKLIADRNTMETKHASTWHGLAQCKELIFKFSDEIKDKQRDIKELMGRSVQTDASIKWPHSDNNRMVTELSNVHVISCIIVISIIILVGACTIRMLVISQPEPQPDSDPQPQPDPQPNFLSYLFGDILRICRTYFSDPSTFNTTSANSHRDNVSCPICFDDITEGITVSPCDHSICNHCAYMYLQNEISDIGKYPISCFEHNCDTLIHDDAINHIVQLHSDSDHNESEQILAKHRRFTLMSSTPRHLWIDCPNAECLNVLLRSEPPLNDQFNLSKYPSLLDGNRNPKAWESVNECQSELCLQTFSMLKWKYHCTICGDIFCSECVRFKMEIPELGYHEAVDLCMGCFTELFCIQCAECRTMICYRCEMPWHNVCDKDDTENGKCSMVQADENTLEVDRQTRRVMQRNDFMQCPRCGIVIEKVTGCNHMTHTGCPNKTEENGTHFCYCCGEMLFGFGLERDGTRHFPDGSFEKCRKANQQQSCIIM